MRRREFIRLVGGAVTWPVVARAQQPTMPVIGFLRSTRADGFAHLLAAFRAGLNEVGYVEGRNVAIEYRWAEDHKDRLSAMATELVRRPVAVIVGNSVAALAAKAATTTVPIVFATGSDPVRDGLVGSLNRPSGNVTGIVFFSGTLGAKRLELLHQLVPKATSVALLLNPTTTEAEAERRDGPAATNATGQQLIIFDVINDRDIETAFATLLQRRASALLVGSGAFLNSHRERIVALAARYGLPDSYSAREFAAAGGLMSYGTSITDAYRQVGTYAGRILKGEKPGDLPVLQPTKFELVINLKTAKALGLTIPQSMLVAADELIE
jgi:putative ABC transport system substrate-binding protein